MIGEELDGESTIRRAILYEDRSCDDMHNVKIPVSVLISIASSGFGCLNQQSMNL